MKDLNMDIDTSKNIVMLRTLLLSSWMPLLPPGSNATIDVEFIIVQERIKAVVRITGLHEQIIIALRPER